MVPEDVFALTGVTDPRPSPDGKTVAYVVGAVDAQANDYRGAIWLAPADGAAEPRRFTSGVKHDADPRWSPDGAQLAFTSNREGKAMQLYVMPLAGGEPVQLTDGDCEDTGPAWSPDGARLAAQRFPEESHELTRSGSPAHRVQRFQIVLEWFDRYLKG